MSFRLTTKFLLQRGCRQYSSTPTAQELRIPFPWGDVAAKSWGNPSGEPILALHGWLDNAASMDNLAPLLPLDKYHLVAIDLPGHGLSSHYPPGMTYKASDSFFLIHQLQDFFKWEKSKIIGHSLGAGLSAIYSAIFPERIDRLVLLDLINIGPSPVTKQVKRTRQSITETFKVFDKLYNGSEKVPSYTFEDAVGRAYLANTLMHGRDSILRSSVETLMSRGLAKVEGEENKFTWTSDLRLRIPTPFSIVYDQVEAYASSIKCPLLVIKATNSPFYMSEEVAERLIKVYTNSNPNFEYRSVEGGHHVHLNHPERVAPHIIRFLSKKLTDDGTEEKENFPMDLI